jgi:transcription initiation factor IIE alpha subunit
MEEKMEEKTRKVLEAIRKRRGAATDVDLSMSTQLSLGVVRKRIRRLRDDGLIDEYWIAIGSAVAADRGPYYRVK